MENDFNKWHQKETFLSLLSPLLSTHINWSGNVDFQIDTSFDRINGITNSGGLLLNLRAKNSEEKTIKQRQKDYKDIRWAFNFRFSKSGEFLLKRTPNEILFLSEWTENSELSLLASNKKHDWNLAANLLFSHLLLLYTNVTKACYMVCHFIEQCSRLHNVRSHFQICETYSQSPGRKACISKRNYDTTAM